MVEAVRARSWHDGSGLRRRGEPDAGEKTHSGSDARNWVWWGQPFKPDPDPLGARPASMRDDLRALSRRGHLAARYSICQLTVPDAINIDLPRPSTAHLTGLQAPAML